MDTIDGTNEELCQLHRYIFVPQLKLLDKVNKMLCEREMVKHFMKEGDCLSVASLKSKFRGKIRRKKTKSEKKKLMYTENVGNEESDSFSVDTMYQASVDMPFEEKLKNCRDFIFTEEEERYINGRAEEYANSVQPHIYYYIRPMSTSESYLQGHPLYKAYLNGHRVQKAPTKPNKRRSDKCDYHFLTPGNPLRHPSLPIGTQVIRPKDPLTCLVYDTVKLSPDGLLQACHVYTALQNKYPYFTCLDNSAFDSWKKSIRGIMCDKNFLGLKFKTTGIKKKGCFWSLKPDYDPRSERHCVKKTVTKTFRKKDKSREVTVASAVDEMISNSEMTRETQTCDITESVKLADIGSAPLMVDSNSNVILDPLLTACMHSGSEGAELISMEPGLDCTTSYNQDNSHSITMLDNDTSIPNIRIPDVLGESSQYELNIDMSDVLSDPLLQCGPDSLLAFNSLDYVNSTSFDIPNTDESNSFCVEDFLQIDGSNSAESFETMDNILDRCTENK